VQVGVTCDLGASDVWKATALECWLLESVPIACLFDDTRARRFQLIKPSPGDRRPSSPVVPFPSKAVAGSFSVNLTKVRKRQLMIALETTFPGEPMAYRAHGIGFHGRQDCFSSNQRSSSAHLLEYPKPFWDILPKYSHLVFFRSAPSLIFRPAVTGCHEVDDVSTQAKVVFCRAFPCPARRRTTPPTDSLVVTCKPSSGTSRLCRATATSGHRPTPPQHQPEGDKRPSRPDSSFSRREPSPPPHPPAPRIAAQTLPPPLRRGLYWRYTRGSARRNRSCSSTARRGACYRSVERVPHGPPPA